MKFLVLALDGGGARMFLQWKVLSRILDRFPKFLSSVSLFAGTSAGSILAAMLACDKTDGLDAILDPLLMDEIFKRTPCHALVSLNGLVKAKYQNDGLRHLLHSHFGHMTMQAVPHPLFIPAFNTFGHHDQEVDHHAHGFNRQCQAQAGIAHEQSNIAHEQAMAVLPSPRNQHLLDEEAPDWMHARCDRWHNVFYHNLTDDHGQEERVVKVIMQSCAAPTYFPMVDHCVDGGIVHNNPSLAAMSNLRALGILLEDIYILSLGTGEKSDHLVTRPNASLGVLQWLPHILSMMFDANMEATSQSCHEILGKRFFRLNPVLKQEVPLDSMQSFAYMQDVANEVDLSSVFDWIESIDL